MYGLSIVIPAVPGRPERVQWLLSRLNLNAFRHQDIKFETILVDGSMDSEYEDMAKCMGKFMPVKYVSVPIGKFINAGYPRNVGFRLSEGAILCQVDVDWYLSEDFVAGAIEPFLAGKKVVNNGWMIDSSKSARFKSEGQGFLEALEDVLLSEDGCAKEIKSVYQVCEIPGPKPPPSIWLWSAPRDHFFRMGGYDEMYCRKWAYCYHPEVEVLTKDRGWISIADAEKGDIVLTHNKNYGVNQWGRVNDTTIGRNIPELIHFKNNLLDVKVTPNHRMWVREGLYGQWHARPAEQITTPTSYSEYRYATRLSGNTTKWQMSDASKTIDVRLDPAKDEPQELDREAFIKFLAYYIAEGHTRKNFRQVQIAKDPKVFPEQHEEVISIVQKLGYRPSCSNHTITITNRTLAQWIADNCGICSTEKRIPAFIFDEPPAVQRLLIETLLSCDGDEERQYATTSQILCEQLQQLCSVVGYHTSLNKSKPAQGNLKETFILKISTREAVGIRQGHVSTIPYGGNVYCVSVDNELLVVRSNGKTFICGNTREDDDIFWRFVASGLPRYRDSYETFCGIHIWHPAAQRANQQNQLNGKYFAENFQRIGDGFRTPNVLRNVGSQWGLPTIGTKAIIKGEEYKNEAIEEWIARNVPDAPTYEKYWENIDAFVESLG